MRLRVPALHPGEHEVSSIEHIGAGRLRALAVTTATRSDQLPDIPTGAESVPGYEASYWAGIGNAHHAAAAAIEIDARRGATTAVASQQRDPRAQTRMPPSANGLHDSTQQVSLQPTTGKQTRLQQSLFPRKTYGPVR